MHIDPQLTADCHFIGQGNNIAILLNRNSLIPWFILVPLAESTKPPVSIRELYELPEAQRMHLQQLSDRLSSYLIETFGAQKINIAALGNVVEQLHLHVIGRHQGDRCWPKPVWGNLTESEQYSDQALNTIETDVARIIASG